MCTYNESIFTSSQSVQSSSAPYRALAVLAVADAGVRAELPVAGPDGLPVRLARPQPAPGRVPLLAEGLAGGGDGVEGDDVAERSDVRIADQWEGALHNMGIITRDLS